MSLEQESFLLMGRMDGIRINPFLFSVFANKVLLWNPG